jgi:hypothetical protein
MFITITILVALAIITYSLWPAINSVHNDEPADLTICHDQTSIDMNLSSVKDEDLSEEDRVAKAEESLSELIASYKEEIVLPDTYNPDSDKPFANLKSNSIESSVPAPTPKNAKKRTYYPRKKKSPESTDKVPSTTKRKSTKEN